MSSKVFSLTGQAGSQNSGPITVGANERVRVRFQARNPGADVYLSIKSNGVETLVPINDDNAWITDGVMFGDEVAVVSDDGQVVGIIESAA